jgi:proteasome lid subunit RPN8/RPN11
MKSVRLSHTALHRMKVHAMTRYPDECCGFLLGRPGHRWTFVYDVLEMENREDAVPSTRYRIDPADYREAEQRAAGRGATIVGLYHSHTGHSHTGHSHTGKNAEPSEFDREYALPVWSYVIVAVDDGIPAAVRSWHLREDRSAFDPEYVETADNTLASERIHSSIEQHR